MSAKVKGCGCLGLLLPAVVMVWFLIGVGAPEATNFPRPFDPTAWKSEAFPHNVSDGSKRCSMILDLTRRVGLVGRTEAEILSMLGKADKGQNGLPSAYLLCPSFMDIYILELKWRNGRVSSAVVRDT